MTSAPYRISSTRAVWRNEVPAWVRHDPAYQDLRQGVRSTLQAITDRCDRPDPAGNLLNCFGGESLVRECGVSRGTFYQHVALLEAAGFVVCTARGRRGMNIYGVPGARGSLHFLRLSMDVKETQVKDDPQGTLFDGEPGLAPVTPAGQSGPAPVTPVTANPANGAGGAGESAPAAVTPVTPRPSPVAPETVGAQTKGSGRVPVRTPDMYLSGNRTSTSAESGHNHTHNHPPDHPTDHGLSLRCDGDGAEPTTGPADARLAQLCSWLDRIGWRNLADPARRLVLIRRDPAHALAAWEEYRRRATTMRHVRCRAALFDACFTGTAKPAQVMPKNIPANYSSAIEQLRAVRDAERGDRR